MTGPEWYGSYYWCVKTKLSKSGEIYVNADRVEFTSTGGVIFWTDPDARSPSEKADDYAQRKDPILAIAAGHWTAVYAASVIDGHAVAVNHWEGEVIG
jgi:hypothetical protein